MDPGLGLVPAEKRVGSGRAAMRARGDMRIRYRYHAVDEGWHRVSLRERGRLPRYPRVTRHVWLAWALPP